MRLCAFLEAWVQLVGRREPGLAQRKIREIRNRIPQTGVTELIRHHKVAAVSSQPWRQGPTEPVNGWGTLSAYLAQLRGLC
jgi:hypothetical protein